ncbi:kinase-like domain-containing protein [Leptodontidium sp. MPI-SDFR-AT-0119]|nr:kinase-like domain-containing protein [Leptodontidium sp. MPI-SDFR-AT-0119]
MESDSPDRNTRFEIDHILESGSPPPSPIPSSLSSPATAVSSRYATPNEKRLKGPSEQRSTVTKRQKTKTATENTTLTGSGRKDLAIVQAVEQGVSVLDSSVNYESPWNSLRNDYELDLGGFVIIASDRGNGRNSFIVKRFSGPDMASKLRMLQRIRHVNFLSVVQRFSFENSYYAVFDHVSVSLEHVVASPPYLRICELAAILFQILEAVAYLERQNLEHGSLNCSNVLLSPQGVIKITYQEDCRDVTSSQTRLADVKAIGYIAMELMQKYHKDDGAIGLEDFSRYPSDSDAVDFLAATTSATSAEELLRHRLLRNDVQKEQLKWLVGIATTARIGFRYDEGKWEA